MTKPTDVDAYIRTVPKAVQGTLRELRDAIRAVAPKAVERISYGIPYYDYMGRLAYFRLSKQHIGLYIPPPVVAQHAKELKGLVTFNATIHFPLGQKLPIVLIKKLVRARMKLNEERCSGRLQSL